MFLCTSCGKQVEWHGGECPDCGGPVFPTSDSDGDERPELGDVEWERASYEERMARKKTDRVEGLGSHWVDDIEPPDLEDEVAGEVVHRADANAEGFEVDSSDESGEFSVTGSSLAESLRESSSGRASILVRRHRRRKASGRRRSGRKKGRTGKRRSRSGKRRKRRGKKRKKKSRGRMPRGLVGLMMSKKGMMGIGNKPFTGKSKNDWRGWIVLLFMVGIFLLYWFWPIERF